MPLIDWTDCTTGGPVQLLRVQGGGHQLPTLIAEPGPPRPGDGRNHDIETAEMIWHFFSTGEISARVSP